MICGPRGRGGSQPYRSQDYAVILKYTLQRILTVRLLMRSHILDKSRTHNNTLEGVKESNIVYLISGTKNGQGRRRGLMGSMVVVNQCPQ